MSRFDYYAASVWPRWCDTLVTFVALQPGVAQAAAELAAEFEINERWQHDEQDHEEGPCTALACPYCDIIAGVETVVRRNYLFTAAELREHRRELIDGHAIALYP